jgi:ZIP family zinc transporter
MRLLSSRARVGLAMFAVGVLGFLFVDVMSHGVGIVEGAVKGFSTGKESLGHVLALGTLAMLGFGAGTAGLALVERRIRSGHRGPAPMAGAESALAAVTVEEAEAMTSAADAARARALSTGLAVAGAIGVHNFAEGLAIGVSAKAGEMSLATILIVGFALHNATEGFGIIGPLGNVRPSWRWIGLAGLIGGGPVFLGSILGYNVTSEPLELGFYALAGGAILYVIGEIWQSMRRHGHRELGLALLTAGFFLAVATDMVVVYGGG